MRVLHVYSGNLHGGVETFLLTLARHSYLAGPVEHSFALCFEGKLSSELRSAAHVTILGALRARNPLSVIRARHALTESIRGERPDVVVCHSAWSQAIFGPVVRSANLPLVF